MSIHKGKMMAQGMRNDPAYVHPNAINEKKIKHWSHLLDSLKPQQPQILGLQLYNRIKDSNASFQSKSRSRKK